MADNELKFRKLMIESQQGDPTAYLNLLTELSLFLNAYLRRKIFNSQEIDDVIQEILMALHKAKHTYQSDRQFMSWFLSITEYKVVDYIRKNSRVQQSKNEFASIELDFSLDSDLKNDFQKAFERLNNKEKEVVKLLKLEERSTTEVANLLNLSESNVKVIAHRALKNMQLFLMGQE